MRENLSKLSAKYGTTLEDMIQALKSRNDFEDLSIHLNCDDTQKSLLATEAKSRSMRNLCKK